MGKVDTGKEVQFWRCRRSWIGSKEEVKTPLDKEGIMARKKQTVTGRNPSLIIYKEQGNNSIQNL